MLTRDKSINSGNNWNTQADGTLRSSNCKYYPCNDGTYELEFVGTDLPIGIMLETNAYGNYAIVKGVADDRYNIYICWVRQYTEYVKYNISKINNNMK